MKKKLLQLLVAAMTALSLGLAGCGSSTTATPPAPAAAAKTVTINGALEPGAAKATLKTVEAAANAIGVVQAIDAATGAVISTTDADINPDGTFSVKVAPPATQAGVILKAILNSTNSNGKTFRLLVTDALAADTTLSGKAIGPNSDVIVTHVSAELAHGGLLGDVGVAVHTGTKLADIVAKVEAKKNEILPNLSVGYVINTNAGGPAAGTPGFSIIDRANKTVTKTVRFSNLQGVSVNHFANVTADGKELWLCTNKAGGATGDVNVFDIPGFKNYSTLNDSNKGTLIKKSWNVGCGVQNTQTPDGKYIFVSSDQSPKGVNVFDAKNKKYLGNITNGNTAPHVGAVSADGKTYYTSTAGSHQVIGYDISGLSAATESTTDTATRTTLNLTKKLNIDLGYGNIHAIRLHQSGKYLFVGNNTWPVPAGVTAITSGTNVIDVATNKIIANIPGRPHNYAISPDGKYLLVTELSSPDCEVSLPGDPGNRLQFIDISTLLTATPDASKIKDIYHFDTPGEGGSHAAWDPTTGILYYAVYANQGGQGYLYVLDTTALSAATPKVVQAKNKIKIGWNPHAVLFPGINAD